MPNLPPTTALYHPWIDPTNGSTIRTAILYFDHMQTIVPESMEKTCYTNQHSIAARDLGFLRPRVIRSTDESIIRVGQDFMKDFERPAIQSAVEVARQNGDGGWKHNPSRMNAEKLSWEFEQAVFRDKVPDHKGFYDVAAGFGNVYMSRLAAVLSAEDGTSAYTDDSSGHEVFVDCFSDPDEGNVGDKAEAILARLSIEALQIPASVSIGRLWNFRDSHYTELLRYRYAIRKLARTICGFTDAEDLLNEAKMIVANEIVPASGDLQARLSERNIEFGTHVIEGVASGFLTLLTKGPLIGVAVAGIKIGFSKLRQVLAGPRVNRDPFAYLLQAHQHLTP